MKALRALSLRPLGMAALAMALALVLGSLEGAAQAEGSAQVGAGQRLQSTTAMSLDILAAGEEIVWAQGEGTLRVTDLQGTSHSLNPGESFVAEAAGVYTLRISVDQSADWDIQVRRGGLVHAGRLHATRWRFDAGHFNQAAAAYGSYFALVDGGRADQQGVIEMRFEGLAGFIYSLAANRTGVSGGVAGRSVTRSGNAFVEGYSLYLSPPAVANHSWTLPQVSAFDVTLGDASCAYFVPEVHSARFSFQSNVEGTYHLVCDTSGDGVFDRVDNADLLIVGEAQLGTNEVVWNGTDNAGQALGTGSYACMLSLNVGELHYVGDDIETSYEGLRLFSVDSDGGREGLSMFWNDSAVQQWAVAMPDGQVSPASSGAAGLWSGDYADQTLPNQNARAWGNFSGNTKGDGSYLDTFTSLASSESAVLVVDLLGASEDSDGDGLFDYEELCYTETASCTADSDGDGVCDGPLAVAGECVAGPDSDANDPWRCGDVDGDGCEDCAGGTFAPASDGPDRDGDGICDGGEDTDGDGVRDRDDEDDDNDGIRDEDENLLHMHPDGDEDGDGVANAQDACGVSFDSDGDGVPNHLDLDSDGDGILDSEEGACDGDGDGIPDFLDLDRDDDAIGDAFESGRGCVDSDANGVCDGGDLDGDGIDDSIDTEAAFGTATLLPLRDTDGDGKADVDDLDSDGDGKSDRSEAGVSALHTGARDRDDDGIREPGDLHSEEFGGAGPGRDRDHNGVYDHLEYNAPSCLDEPDYGDEGGGKAARKEPRRHHAFESNHSTPKAEPAGCSTSTRGAGWWLAVLALLALPRRRN